MLHIPGVIKVEVLQVAFKINQRFVLWEFLAGTGPSTSLMICIICQADPTELMFAVGASHMHATLVFVNVYTTLRAFFCVQFYPGSRVLFNADLLLPGLQRLAV